MAIGYVWHPLFAWHDTGTYAGLFPASPLDGLEPYEHFEHPDTKRRLHELVETSGLLKHVRRITPAPASWSDLERVHERGYLERIARASATGGGTLGRDGGSPFGQGSFEIARLAAGGTLAAMDAVVGGDVERAYALVRPPGHHARSDYGMGFCLVNNIAVAVARALERSDVRRVCVVDWDVHHGNGTQQVFYDDPRVLTISLHQDENYPRNSGHLHETGDGDGKGTSINVPLPPGTGHGAYLAAFDQVVIPALHRYRPDFIVVAAGYDSGAFDPLGRQMLTTETYRHMTRRVMDAATELSAGRIVVSHEGGYSPVTVPFHGLAVLEELAGVRSGIHDPYEPVHAAMGQQALQPHQHDVIQQAADLVSNIPTCT
jgi:acetoin utilization deacetylase AcuC-like enzyme